MIARLLERIARRNARRGFLACRTIALRLGNRRPVAAPIEEDRVRRIVTIRLDRLGDLVLTLPALDDLAAAYPKARVTAMVRPGLAPLLRDRPSVGEAIAVPPDEDERTLALRIERVEADLAVDFSPADDLLAARALAAAGVPFRVGSAGGGRGVFFHRAVRPGPGPDSLPEINASLVEGAGGTATLARPTYVVAPEDDREAETLLRALGARPGRLRIGVHPGGFFPTQRWPTERFAEAATALAARRYGKIVVLGGPDDEPLVKALRESLDSGAVVVPPSGLVELAAVLGRCDLLLANNSGPLHLAGAVGLPTVSVMGPTDPARFWPWGEHQAVIRRDELACSPCKRGRCRSHECLKGIEVRDVVNAAEGLLDSQVARRPRVKAGTGR